MNGQQTISSDTTTEVSFSGTRGMYAIRVSSESYVGYASDVDDSDGYILDADKDYMFTVSNEPFYIYSSAGCTLYYLKQT